MYEYVNSQFVSTMLLFALAKQNPVTAVNCHLSISQAPGILQVFNKHLLVE